VRFVSKALPGCQFAERRDPDDVAVALHRQAVDIEQGIERTPPRHIDEIQ
jgi:hypothetical protein